LTKAPGIPKIKEEAFPKTNRVLGKALIFGAFVGGIFRFGLFIPKIEKRKVVSI
jgi:hypothetical protein